MEIWKKIPNYSNYLISTNGKIKNLKRNSLLNINYERFKNSNSYVRIHLKNNHFFLHRLILMTFNPVDNYKNLQCNHKDTNIYNNNLYNLEWLTAKENSQHYVLVKKNKKNIINKKIPKIPKINLENEKWKQFLKTKYTIYFISNYGRIKSFRNKEIILKQNLKSYFVININKKNYYIHKLVATYFLKNPNNYTIVDHNDTNRYNNFYKNLKWIKNQSENMNNPITKSKLKKKRFSKLIIQYNLNGSKVKEWDNIKEICKFYKIKNSQNIYACLTGSQNTSIGFKWKYKNNIKNDFIMNKRIIKKKCDKVAQLDLNCNLIRIFKNCIEAAKFLKINYSSIYRVCNGKYKTSNGFKWKYI